MPQDLQPTDNAEGGFALVEVVVAMALFAIVAVGFAASLGASLKTVADARSRTVGKDLATEVVEDTRALAYESIGVVGGNPPGTIPASATRTVDGTDYVVLTTVQYADDPLPGGYQTFANYKVVRVKVQTAAGKRLAELETVMAPPTQPSLTRGVVQVLVVDNVLNTPVTGATVRLLTGPDAPRSGTTRADGTVVFAALTPNPATGPTSVYDVVVDAPGYAVLYEDVPPSSAARTRLAPTQLFSTALRVFRPAALDIDLVDGAGIPWLQPTTVTVSSRRGSQSFTTNTGTLAVTSVANEPVMPELEYTVGASSTVGTYATAVRQIAAPGYPTSLRSQWTLELAPRSTSRLNVQLRDATDNRPLPGGTRVVVGGGPYDALVEGATNNGGVTVLDVPSGSGPYTVTVPASPGYAAAEGTVEVLGNGTTVVTIDVPRAP